jgi:hypothetical protein
MNATEADLTGVDWAGVVALGVLIRGADLTEMSVMQVNGNVEGCSIPTEHSAVSNKIPPVSSANEDKSK